MLDNTLAARLICAFALSSSAATAQSNSSGACLQTKSVEAIVVTKATFQDRDPPGCTSSQPDCIRDRLVVVSFHSQGDKDVSPLMEALFNETDGVYVITEDNTRYRRVRLTVESKSKDFRLLFYAASGDSTKYKLYWPGNNPVDLAPFFEAERRQSTATQ